MGFGHWLMLFVLCSVVAQAQQQDSLFVKQQGQIESIRKDFYQQSDSIKQVYSRKLSLLSVSSDSLSKALPTITNRVDSLSEKRQSLISSLQHQIDSLKQQTTNRLNQLPLPDDVSSKVSNLSDEIESFKLPVGDLPIEGIADAQLPALDFSRSSIDIPNLDASLADIPTSLNVGDEINTISDYSQQAGELTNGLEQVTTIPEAIENKALETSGLSSLTDQTKNLELLNSTNPDELKQEIIDQAQQQAVDHFAGKEEVLAETMAKISKLKRKYSSLNSLSEIPKRRPNEMKGKPVIERLLPQVVFQVYTRNDDVLVDWANLIGWRFTGRLTSGAGWNQRIGYSKENNSFHNEKRVYGPRVFAEYKWVKGFKPRMEVEYMRTFIPPNGSGSKHDPVIQEWVPAVFAGLNKEYKFFGRVKGTSQVMFRIAGNKHKSPYNDIVNVRFGFEFPMKKAVKSVTQE